MHRYGYCPKADRLEGNIQNHKWIGNLPDIRPDARYQKIYIWYNHIKSRLVEHLWLDLMKNIRNNFWRIKIILIYLSVKEKTLLSHIQYNLFDIQYPAWYPDNRPNYWTAIRQMSILCEPSLCLQTGGPLWSPWERADTGGPRNQSQFRIEPTHQNPAQSFLMYV